ncbi:DUF616 domain-containing protein [Candidatus Pacearchaeota archaeon]|nr:DUF616 domain-containing protein [Candidatus Pacearchaeota archaeon]
MDNTSQLIVYSCITAASNASSSYDNIEKLCNSKFIGLHNIEYVLFTDVHCESYKNKWEIRPLHPQTAHLNLAQNLKHVYLARWHKTHPHILFPGKTTLWIDGNQIPYGNIDTVLSQLPFGSFKHPKRDCIYDELEACIRQRKDDPEIMRSQIEKYRNAGYPRNNGLAETCCLLRDSSINNIQFNEAWWSEIENHSYRDQLSFNYVMWKLGMSYNNIPGCRSKSKFLRLRPHIL